MKISSEVADYCIVETKSVSDALLRLDKNIRRCLIVVDQSNRLKGTVTAGDINRYIIREGSIDKSVSILEVINRECTFVYENEYDQELLPNGLDIIPIVDEQRHVVGVFSRKATLKQIKLSETCFVGKEHPIFIIAEVGNNHNGSVDLAKKLVREAVLAGANCVKFQLRDMDSLYGASLKDDTQNLGSQYTLDLLRRFQLPAPQLIEVMKYAESKGILSMCTPWDEASVDILEEAGVPAYKVASADLTNHGLLRYIGRTGKPMFCSTGMATESEITDAVEVLSSIGAPFVLLHCNSTYPAPFKDVNLAYMSRLESLSSGCVGYSGHERGINVGVAAAALGAVVIEKHFTLDRKMEGNDHKVSLLPKEFAQMVEGIRQVELAIGNAERRVMTQGELMNRVTLAKSLFASKDLKAGSVVRDSDIQIKSPGHGLQPNRITDLVGVRISRSIKAGEVFYPMDLESEEICPREYSFVTKWGIPVRHHDYKKLYELCSAPVLEFHLSYKDLTLENSDYLDNKIDSHLVVHAPELFENDHTLDLCSPDENYRQQSLAHMRRTILTAAKLKQHFNNRNEKVGLVTNVGGFSHNGPLTSKEIRNRERILEKSLKELESPHVEIWPQTMPPFPWHFGGQQFHNLFLDATWIREFCLRNSIRICLDVSHSILQCNHVRGSFSQFLDKVLPHTAHLHLADGSGVDGEGLQINEGCIDFNMLAEKVQAQCPEATWIPEIWQGHEENGRGFWTALTRLEEAGF